MKKFLFAAALATAAISGVAMAGPMADFENAMHTAYGDYRGALFATNTGKADQAAAAVAKFTAEWSKLAGEPAPPQYEDDSEYSSTMRAVLDLASKANDAIGAGKLPEAHEILEGIRDQIGGLHARAGLYGISDRMNAYHARMEEVIGNTKMDANTLREEAAVLGYLIDDVIAHPPAGADPSFATMSAEVKASVEALKAAANDGGPEAIKKAVDGLKKPYTMLFLKFG